MPEVKPKPKQEAEPKKKRKGRPWVKREGYQVKREHNSTEKRHG